jgi:hypothetical protein
MATRAKFGTKKALKDAKKASRTAVGGGTISAGKGLALGSRAILKSKGKHIIAPSRLKAIERKWDGGAALLKAVKELEKFAKEATKLAAKGKKN